MLDTTIPIPASGRTFTSTRRIRLSDMDAAGRVRLDALARYLQDIAIDDVQETGWGLPEHVWFVRRMRIDVHRPLLDDRSVSLTTWSSGRAAIAAGRRWSVEGDAGGRIEVDSVWIHLDADQRPARIADFGVYAGSAGNRLVSTKFELPDPPARRHAHPVAAPRLRRRPPWPREQHRLLAGGRGQAGADLREPHRAELEYRQPSDLGDEIALVPFDDCVAVVAGDAVKAVARVAAI